MLTQNNSCGTKLRIRFLDLFPQKWGNMRQPLTQSLQLHRLNDHLTTFQGKYIVSIRQFFLIGFFIGNIVVTAPIKAFSTPTSSTNGAVSQEVVVLSVASALIFVTFYILEVCSKKMHKSNN
jgi:hypothetical protein